MENSMEEMLRAAEPYLPYALVALPLLVGLVGVSVRYRVRGFARETIGAVYRVALQTADELQDAGIAWIKSDDGIAFRKQLAECAYDLLPARLGPIPLGILKMVYPRERFCLLIETLFSRMVATAEELTEKYLVDANAPVEAQ